MSGYDLTNGVLILMAIIFLTPSFIGYGRNHQSAHGILVLNLIMGSLLVWALINPLANMFLIPVSGIGWIAAMVWSFSATGLPASISTRTEEHNQSSNKAEWLDPETKKQQSQHERKPSITDELIKLSKLKQAKLISEEEFDQAKKKLLS